MILNASGAMVLSLGISNFSTRNYFINLCELKLFLRFYAPVNPCYSNTVIINVNLVY